MIDLAHLNEASEDEFVAALDGIFEHSPWVAARAVAYRPFASRAQLIDCLHSVVQAASVEEQIALIRAHPKLGARGGAPTILTSASQREQRRAGLDACTDEEYSQLLRLNEEYLARFGFPFILAVRGHDPRSIIAACSQRLHNDAMREHQTALEQIGLIAGFRLAERVAGSPVDDKC
jgi:OHCU decarboxylase